MANFLYRVIKLKDISTLSEEGSFYCAVEITTRIPIWKISSRWRKITWRFFILFLFYYYFLFSLFYSLFSLIFVHHIPVDLLNRIEIILDPCCLSSYRKREQSLLVSNPAAHNFLRYSVRILYSFLFLILIFSWI